MYLVAGKSFFKENLTSQLLYLLYGPLLRKEPQRHSIPTSFQRPKPLPQFMRAMNVQPLFDIIFAWVFFSIFRWFVFRTFSLISCNFKFSERSSYILRQLIFPETCNLFHSLPFVILIGGDFVVFSPTFGELKVNFFQNNSNPLHNLPEWILSVTSKFLFIRTVVQNLKYNVAFVWQNISFMREKTCVFSSNS